MPHGDGGEYPQCAQINYRNAITAAIGDVCVLMVVGAGLWRFFAAAEQGQA